jgi:hypothetical protein
MRDFLANTSPGYTAYLRFGQDDVRILVQQKGTLPRLAELLAQMLDIVPQSRPTIDKVWLEVSSCREDGFPLCGDFCLPPGICA